MNSLFMMLAELWPDPWFDYLDFVDWITNLFSKAVVVGGTRSGGLALLKFQWSHAKQHDFKSIVVLTPH